MRKTLVNEIVDYLDWTSKSIEDALYHFEILEVTEEEVEAIQEQICFCPKEKKWVIINQDCKVCEVGEC